MHSHILTHPVTLLQMTAAQLQRMSHTNGAYDGVPYMQATSNGMNINGGHLYDNTNRQQHVDYFAFDQHVPTTSHSYAHIQPQVDAMQYQHHRRLPPTPDQVQLQQQQFSGGCEC